MSTRRAHRGHLGRVCSLRRLPLGAHSANHAHATTRLWPWPRTRPVKAALSRTGQAFAADYVLAFVLFIIGLLFGLKIIINIFSTQTFSELQDDAVAIADELMSPGYPPNWTEATVMRVGLLTDGVLDPQKVLRFSRLNYTRTLGLLSTRHDYRVSFEDAAGGAVALDGVCGVGNAQVQQNISSRTAIFFRDTQGFGTDYALVEPLRRVMAADLYFQDEDPGNTALGYTLAGGFNDLLTGLWQYTLVVVEDPDLRTWRGANPLWNVTDVLERWVSQGRTLVLTGFVNGNTSFFAAWPPAPQTAAAPAFLASNDSIFAWPVGENFTPEEPSPVLLQYNLSSSAVLANFSDGQAAIVRWNVGLGNVLYISDVLAQNGTNLSDAVIPGLQLLARNCTAPDFSAANVRDLALFSRVAPYHSGLVRLKVAVWEAAS